MRMIQLKVLCESLKILFFVASISFNERKILAQNIVRSNGANNMNTSTKMLHKLDLQSVLPYLHSRLC